VPYSRAGETLNEQIPVRIEDQDMDYAEIRVPLKNFSPPNHANGIITIVDGVDEHVLIHCAHSSLPLS
jgi:hypothetical protein